MGRRRSPAGSAAARVELEGGTGTGAGTDATCDVPPKESRTGSEQDDGPNGVEERPSSNRPTTISAAIVGARGTAGARGWARAVDQPGRGGGPPLGRVPGGGGGRLPGRGPGGAGRG